MRNRFSRLSLDELRLLERLLDQERRRTPRDATVTALADEVFGALVEQEEEDRLDREDLIQR